MFEGPYPQSSITWIHLHLCCPIPLCTTRSYRPNPFSHFILMLFWRHFVDQGISSGKGLVFAYSEWMHHSSPKSEPPTRRQQDTCSELCQAYLTSGTPFPNGHVSDMTTFRYNFLKIYKHLISNNLFHRHRNTVILSSNLLSTF